MKYLVQPVIDGATNFPGQNPNKKYWMASVASGLVASLDDNAYGPNALELIQKSWTENENQQWKFEPTEMLFSTFYKIVSVKDGKVLTVSGDELIATNADDGIENQFWKLKNLGYGRFKIEFIDFMEFMNNGKVLGVTDPLSRDDRGRIRLEHETDSPSQQWLLAEVCENRLESTYDKRATIYEHADYQGRSQELGPGSYLMRDLKIGNDTLSSLKVPEGIMVVLYEHENFRGKRKIFGHDTTSVGSDFNDLASAILVVPAATYYDGSDFSGKKGVLGVGITNLSSGDEKLSSIKVPQGLIVTLYEHHNLTGRKKIFLEDATYVGNDFNNMTSSVAVKAVGVVIPENALRFGSTISLKSYHGKYLFAKDDGSVIANEVESKDMGFFTIVRSGNTKHSSFISYGDTISLISANGKFLSASSGGKCSFSKNQIDARERFTLVRAGSTENKNFVTDNDVIGLKSVDNKFMSGWIDGKCNFPVTWLKEWERWTIGLVPPPAGALRYGSTISLRSFHGKYLHTEVNGTMTADKSSCNEWERYTVIRSGSAKYNSLVNYGDVISLQSVHGKYLTAWPLSYKEGIGEFVASEINEYERIVVVNPRNESDKSIVLSGDAIALKSHHGTFMSAWPRGKCAFPVTWIKDWEKWTIESAAADAAATSGGSESSAVSGQGACSAAACGAEMCNADYCGAAVCAAAAGLYSACGLAASVIAVCAADVAGISGCIAAAAGAAACGGDACGLAACGLAAGGLAACGADACDLAVCGAAACGAAGCGAAGCGADACGAATCPADAGLTGACAAQASAIGACPADACAANTCAINLCPADACLADACLVDLLPIIPFI